MKMGYVNIAPFCGMCGGVLPNQALMLVGAHLCTCTHQTAIGVYLTAVKRNEEATKKAIEAEHDKLKRQVMDK